MTQELSKEQKLVALIASQPAADPAVCALDRAANAIGLVPTGCLKVNAQRSHDWIKVAQQLGFSNSEHYGIMDGWDVASLRVKNGTFINRCPNSLDHYWRGFEIGVKCWRAAQK